PPGAIATPTVRVRSPGHYAYRPLKTRADGARLVRDGHVAGWDDPRMPTLAGLSRRGVPPEAVRRFIRGVGVSEANSTVDDGVLDAAIRDVLNERAQRRMAVLKPLKVTIENYPAGRIEEFDAPNHPADPAFGTRVVRFSREVYIEQDDLHE